MAIECTNHKEESLRSQIFCELNELGLTDSTLRELAVFGVGSTEELVEFTASELSENLPPTMVGEIQSALSAEGHRLKPEPADFVGCAIQDALRVYDSLGARPAIDWFIREIRTLAQPGRPTNHTAIMPLLNAAADSPEAERREKLKAAMLAVGELI